MAANRSGSELQLVLQDTVDAVRRVVHQGYQRICARAELHKRRLLLATLGGAVVATGLAVAVATGVVALVWVLDRRLGTLGALAVTMGLATGTSISAIVLTRRKLSALSSPAEEVHHDHYCDSRALAQAASQGGRAGTALGSSRAESTESAPPYSPRLSLTTGPDGHTQSNQSPD